MARIKIDIPPGFITTLYIPVRITDLNYGNHLGNDSLVSILHEARVQWLKLNGYTELDIEGTSLIMGDLAVEYVSESFYGDVLQVSISAAGITRVSFELYYLLETNRQGNTITVAKAKTGMVCYDYGLKRIAPVPHNLVKALEHNSNE
jgi:acyl-CoA thioesterase FadM